MQMPAFLPSVRKGLSTRPVAGSAFVRPRGRVAEEQTIPDGPPLQRLTSLELRNLSAQWRTLAEHGDESAERVALALEWVADQRARKEPTRVKVLAERISQWVGL